MCALVEICAEMIGRSRVLLTGRSVYPDPGGLPGLHCRHHRPYWTGPESNKHDFSENSDTRGVFSVTSLAEMLICRSPV